MSDEALLVGAGGTRAPAQWGRVTRKRRKFTRWRVAFPKLPSLPTNGMPAGGSEVAVGLTRQGRML